MRNYNYLVVSRCTIHKSKYWFHHYKYGIYQLIYGMGLPYLPDWIFFVLNGQQMKWPPVLMDDDFKRKCVHVPIWHVLSSPIYLCSIYMRDGEKKALKEVAHHQRASFNISRGVNEFSFPTLPPPRHPSLNETNSNFKWCWSALRRVSEFSSKEKTSLSR